MNNTVKRNGTVDFMRFVFAFVIMIYHGRNLGGGKEIALFREAGYIGVEYFFLVSGFLMAKSAARLSAQGADSSESLGVETILFIWRKIKSLLPYYVFAAIFSFSLSVVKQDMSAREAILNLIRGVFDLCFLRASGIKTFGMIRAIWYLSAMFISMLALYPLLRILKDRFTYILAPFLAILFLGYLSQTYGNLNQSTEDFRLVFSGILRAVAELSLGCICYEICEKIKTVRLTSLSRILITALQVAGYSAVILSTTRLPIKQFDFVMLLTLFVCVPLSFSGQGIAAPLFQGTLFPLLGKLSLILYLNHMWVKDTLALILPKSLGYPILLIAFLCCTLIVSGICLLWEKLLHWFWKCYGQRITTIFIMERTETV